MTKGVPLTIDEILNTFENLFSRQITDNIYIFVECMLNSVNFLTFLVLPISADSDILGKFIVKLSLFTVVLFIIILLKNAFLFSFLRVQNPLALMQFSVFILLRNPVNLLLVRIDREIKHANLPRQAIMITQA